MQRRVKHTTAQRHFGAQNEQVSTLERVYDSGRCDSQWLAMATCMQITTAKRAHSLVEISGHVQASFILYKKLLLNNSMKYYSRQIPEHPALVRYKCARHFTIMFITVFNFELLIAQQQTAATGLVIFSEKNSSESEISLIKIVVVNI